MSNQKRTVGNSDKMKAKDFITLGIFTALFFVVVMVCIFACAVTVVTYAFGPAIAAIPGGIIYMLMRVKVPKIGSILLSGVVIGVIEFLIGAGWPCAFGFIIGALLAEFISRMGSYKNFWSNAIGYAVYMSCFALGTFWPVIMMTNYIDSMTSSNGVDSAFMEQLYGFISGPMLIAIIAVSFIAGMLGSLLTKILFQKHFKKAGII